MKMKIEFDDHDEYDAVVNDLASMAHEAVRDEKREDVLVFVKLLDKLLHGEILEP